eukprot:270562_1
MGNCFAKGTEDEQRINKEITNKMSNNIKQEEATHRILLLGPGDSGKTTILKQMRQIYLGIIPKNEIENYKIYIRQQIIQFIKILCKQSTILNETVQCVESHKAITNIEKTDMLTLDIINHIKILWGDIGIKNTLKQRCKFQIPDNVEYFYNERLDDIIDEQYIPTFEDYIRIRIRTTGFNEEQFSMWAGNKHKNSQQTSPQNSIMSMSRSTSSDGDTAAVDMIQKDANVQQKRKGRKHDFIFIDVGGQRSERKKWINMMKENIDVVLYIIAISEYDLVCFEDENTLRLNEALNLFDNVMKAGFLSNKTVTIFFNKHDLLLEKLKDESTLSPKHYFEDFPSNKNDRDPNEFCEYIYGKFVEIYKRNLPDSNTTPHYLKTSALDTKQIESLMGDIAYDVMSNLFTEAGLGDVGGF